jgi:putative ABC transport system ATP-binding protein
MIELENVKKAFNQGRANECWAVRGISLTLATDGATVLKGPSGSGKTTLLSMIGCLSRPTSGRITLHGRALSGLPERFMTAARRDTFGFVFQQFNLINGLTVLENVMLPAYPLAPDHASLKASALQLLTQFGLRQRASHQAQWLSGGEAQRAAICRALINRPQILLADEPTANLDTRLAAQFMVMVSELVGMGKAVLMTSHDPVVYGAAQIARVIEMRDGLLAEH